MPQENDLLSHEITGRVAAPGLAAGPVFRLEGISAILAVKPKGPTDPGNEGVQLAQAVEAAKSGLSELMDRADAESAAIVEFQIAMLEDEALAEPAIDAIAEGATAGAAWTKAMDDQIAEYRSAEDEIFSARAVDLVDLRDRILRHLTGAQEAAIPPGSILIGSDITPTRFLETDWGMGGGIALTAGSASSHVAVLARARGVPMIVGLGAFDLGDHNEAIVDAGQGVLILSPGQDQQEVFDKQSAELTRVRAKEAEFALKPAKTVDGVAVRVMANVAGPEDLDMIVEGTCDGIGLMRSEFMFSAGSGLPSEGTQLTTYRMMLSWADGKPVVIRTIDAGGDKPVPGLTPDGDANPFLGLRGVRLSLAKPDIFRVQLRAVARAAAEGDLKVMLPMVTNAGELAAAGRLLDEAVAELQNEGVACARPPLGIMIEVPAVALEPGLLSDADFFSIGSNDLTQYVMASARDNAAVAALNDSSHPAVIGLIERVVAYANEAGIEISICGDMAGDPHHIETLLRSGLRTLSVAPAAIGRVKATIAAIDLSTGRA